MEDPEIGGFSRPVTLAELTAEGLALSLRANAAERRALALRFALLDLPALDGEVRIRTNLGGEVEISGRFVASVQQTCVVTLEPFASRLEESFVLRFVRGGSEAEPDRVWCDSDDMPPEAIEGDAIDLGELLAQQLGLAMDPFPRRPGARVDPALLGTEAGAERESPFSLLAGLKTKRSE